ncbi:hypothetical protein ACHAWO_006667 [Cyclotella atomus]|uniref:Bromo domain-containing protein n=1 Tax=Cyclotella atomus TaxID=382360 RepID=A0ABD3QC35_9STRA
MDAADMGAAGAVKEEETGDVVMTENGNGQQEHDDVEMMHEDDTTQEKSQTERANGSEKPDNNGATAAAAHNNEAADAAPQQPQLVLTGTLSYSSQETSRRQHYIRGNWKFENALSTSAQPQRFELLRTIPPEEDLTTLPADGEYHGTFSLAYEYKNKQGKSKIKRRNIPETGVKISFVKVEDKEGEYQVKGTGLNEYGVFELIGTATKNTLEDDPGYSIRLMKAYTLTKVPSHSEEKKDKEDQQQNNAVVEKPQPTELPKENVVCLRGKLSRNTSADLSLGLGDVVHKISGVWAMGLDYILDDPNNTKALCNKFEYEHKCSGESTVFPLSGKYTGYFYVDTNDGMGGKTKIVERDVMLKFVANSEGYHNVEGKGSNIYGRYTISGTLDEKGVITLFRHFQAQKLKISSKKREAPSTLISTPAPGPLNAADKKGAAAPDLSLENLPMAFDEVKAPDGSELVPISSPPAIYGAVSKGIFKITDDGHHSCSGNWALTFDQLSNGATCSSFYFGILPNIAAEDAKTMLQRMDSVGATKHDDRKAKPSGSGAMLNDATFPIDSARYRGSFKMKKAGQKFTTVKDDQIILKFVKNASGSYNVYGKGTNNMGVYDITGTLILQTDVSGHLILYRVYPLVAVEPVPAAQVSSKSSGKVFSGSLTERAVSGRPSVNPPEKFTPSASSLQRRESGRQVKAPLRLEEDDPEAQRASALEKCRAILKDLMARDTQSIFAIPVDPIALGIPTYFDIITEPMDLGTIQSQLDSGDLDSPDEFIRLVRLVFENAIKFNTMPNSFVAITARSLLQFFNSRIKSVERVVDGQKNRKLTKAEAAELKRKEKEAKKKGKRKGSEEGGGDHKRRKLSQFVIESKALLDSIAQVTSQVSGDSVPRAAFDTLMELVQLQNEHMVSIHRLALKSPGGSSSKDSLHSPAPAAAAITSYEIDDRKNSPKKKKAKTEKQEKKAKPPLSPEYYHNQSPVVNMAPLTFDEQEALSEDINNLAEDLLPGAMDIIRQADGVNDDDEEIDLDLDMLDIKTQRKLQQYILENVKKPKRKDRKRKSAAAAPAPMPAPSPESEEKPSTVNSRPSGKSFFSLGQDDSDSDDEPDTIMNQVEAKDEAPAAADPFALEDDVDDDEDVDLNADAIAANWVANSSQDTNQEEETGQQDSENGEDDLWDRAKKEAEASKAIEADRAKREEKMIAEANIAMQKRMEEAQAIGEEVRAQREVEAAEEARRLEEQEREAENARNAAREKALQEVNDVKNTIDLDAQRELMKQYEQEFNDNYSAGASPSSDFGF